MLYKIIFLFIFGISSLIANETKNIVAIDIGHTTERYGTTSARGIHEYQFNKRLAFELLSAMKAERLSGFIINPNGKEISLKDRTRIAKEHNAVLFLSLHHDAAQDKYFSKWNYQNRDLRYSDTFSGYSLFISLSNKNHKENKRFASILGGKFQEAGFIPTLHHSEPISGENRVILDEKKGIYQFDELAVLRTATMPAILIESGVIVNRDEEALLNTTAYRKKIIYVIIDSIKTYLGR